MIKWFKKYFIPHEYNDHKPHILRGRATLFIVGIVFFIEAVFLLQVFVLFPNIKFFADILVSALVQDTNADRIVNNLSDLKINSLLMQAAQAKADDMAANGYFAHISPKGITPWYWLQKAGYEYTYAGENLAMNFSDSEEVVNAWMNSPGHRQNILNGNFTDIGIGISKGIYQNRETVFIVQMLGRPAQVSASSPAAPAPPATPQPVALKSLQPAVSPTPTEETQMFVAVQNANQSEVSPTQTTNVKSNAGQNFSVSTFITNLVASPSTRTKYFYLVILGIISIALVLNILIRVRIQHPRIILNGIALLLIINTVLIINQYLINVNGKVF